MKVGIIGYGSMGKMLLWKFWESGRFTKGDLLAANRTPEKLKEAADEIRSLAPDLIVTCASRHSRNRKAGFLLGKGYTMDEAMKEVKMVVEGVYSAKAAKQLSEKYGVEMPIVSEVCKVLFEGKAAEEAVSDLMLRDKKVETPMLPW